MRMENLKTPGGVFMYVTVCIECLMVGQVGEVEATGVSSLACLSLGPALS